MFLFSIKFLLLTSGVGKLSSIDHPSSVSQTPPILGEENMSVIHFENMMFFFVNLCLFMNKGDSAGFVFGDVCEFQSYVDLFLD